MKPITSRSVFLVAFSLCGAFASLVALAERVCPVDSNHFPDAFFTHFLQGVAFKRGDPPKSKPESKPKANPAPDADAAVKKALRQRYDQSIDAIQKKDTAAYMRLLPDDYQGVEANGTVMNRSQYEQAMKQSLASLKSIKGSYVIHKIEVKGDKAIVTATEKTKAILSIQGSNHTLDSTQEVKNTWVKTPSGWKLKREEVTKSTDLMDGKPLPK